MLARRLVPALAVVAVLVVVPLSWPSELALDGNGVISGSDTSYTLVVNNTGTEPIRCFALFPPPSAGVNFTAASGPAGWSLATPDGRFVGGQTAGQGIPPGGSATFTFTTSAQYPPGVGGDLFISATCQPGSDLRRTATGPNPRTVSPPPPPATPPPPPPPAGGDEDCECTNITTKVTRTALNFTDEGRWHFQLVWQITCTGKAKKKCVGHVEIEPPKGYTITTPPPKKQTFACIGRCAKKNLPQALFVGGPHPKDMNSIKERRNERLVFRFKRSCGSLLGEDHRELGVSRLTVVYNKKGIPDQKASDFNANGVPDGKEK